VDTVSRPLSVRIEDGERHATEEGVRITRQEGTEVILCEEEANRA
jgi:hypothetical protein